MVVSKVQIIVSCQEALKQILDCTKVSICIKHKINSFLVDYYLLTWFSGWHNRRYNLQNITVVTEKKAETNGSVVCLFVQNVLWLKQARTSLHAQGLDRWGEDVATTLKPSKEIVTLIPSALCMPSQLWLVVKKQHVILAEMFCMLSSSFKTKEKYAENTYACDAMAVFMNWLLHEISGSFKNTEPSSSYITPRYYKADILTNSHQL